jgi:5-methylcytosine-specific restriction enzyme A
MPSSPKTICPCGCRTIVEQGTRCERSRKQPRQWEKNRESAHDRGYTAQWTKLSRQYRRMNPLCVICLTREILKACECTDHIIPVRCCRELSLDWGNLQAACSHCNTLKKRTDPTESWTPQHNRIVVCGLRGTGKTTFAKRTGYPYWDTDEHEELTTIEAVQQERTKWINSLRSTEPCVVIVASTITAPQIASQIRGVVRHMTTRYVTREPHRYFGGV